MRRRQFLLFAACTCFSCCVCLGAEPPAAAVAPFDADAAKKYQADWARHLGKEVVATNTIGMKFVLIPAGEFTMGSNQGEPNERPEHRVRLTKSFYLGRTEVTQGQWIAVMKSKPWEERYWVKEGADHAASNVSWHDAAAFCEKLSAKEGKRYRLPTEAEWEHACRAGTETNYSFGTDYRRLGEFAWFRQNAADVDQSYAHAVAGKLPNAWGLYDMLGNVREWCEDGYDKKYYAVSPAIDPPGAPTMAERVGRGGSWNDGDGICNCADRYGYVPEDRSSPCLGFRVVLVP